MMGLIGVSLLSGSLALLCPSRHKKYFRLLCGLCLLAAMAGPMAELAHDGIPALTDGLLSEEELMSDYDEIYKESLAQADADYLESFLKTQLVNEFLLKDEELSVCVSLEHAEDTFMLKKTTLILRGSAVTADPHAMAERIRELSGAPCEIVYE